VRAPGHSAGPAGRPATPRPTVCILGVAVTDATKSEAIARMTAWIDARDGRSRAVFIVNAHTLNLACEDTVYRDTLNSADVVFGDGTGVRFAARRKGVRLRDNLVGTDLLPALFHATRTSTYRYFLLGGTPDTAARAAARLRNDFRGICIAGHHDGFFAARETTAVVRMINAAEPDVLLVAMGNPLQERWIAQHLAALRVPVSIGVGGLFDHWAGTLQRAPQWIRDCGMEWVHILVQQPHKWRRYVLGNPKFVARALAEAHPADAGGRETASAIRSSAAGVRGQDASVHGTRD